MEQSFLKLITDNKKIITKYCYIYSSQMMSFEDLYQETVLNLWKSYGKFRNESKVSTWVYRITINTCISFVRKKYKMPTRQPLDTLPLAIADEPSESTEQFEKISECLNLLNPVDKSIILLWLDGKSYSEIAEILILSETNVSTRLSRAKSQLKKIITSKQ